MRATPHNLQDVFSSATERATSKAVLCPPAFLEYTWYAVLFYAMLGQAWGIVIPFVGGGLLMFVAATCYLSVSGQALQVYKPIAWALCTGILIIAIQVSFHAGGDRAEAEITNLLSWLEVLIIAQSLSLRPGFLQRFALVALAIGVASLAFVNVRVVGGVMRAWASGTGLANPNALGMWFGCCTVYFLFWGVQCRDPMFRIVSWTVAVGCFYVVLIAVSRGPLLGVVLACIVGFRSALKGSFVPLLTLALMLSLVYVSGIFDEWFGYYAHRSAEKTGRDILWPVAMERILNSPWVGVGLNDIRMELHPGFYVNPHNALLHIGLGAGIVPVISFLAYLCRAAIGALHIMRREYVGEAALIPPLVAYTLFIIMLGDFAFMVAWPVVVFGLAASADQAQTRQRSMTA